jgi:hypothetical protein
MPDLKPEIDRFRNWADARFPEARFGEWECEYEHWPALYAAVFEFLSAKSVETWTDEEVRSVLYAVARDNEPEHLAGEMRRRHPTTLVSLARSALQFGERDAKWQLAEELGHLGQRGGEAEELLLILVRDEAEYVRRRALRALARLGSPAVEELAMEAWHRPNPAQEYARMMALWSLHRVGSPHLQRLLAKAEADERPYLSAYAVQVRRGEVDA